MKEEIKVYLVRLQNKTNSDLRKLWTLIFFTATFGGIGASAIAEKHNFFIFFFVFLCLLCGFYVLMKMATICFTFIAAANIAQSGILFPFDKEENDKDDETSSS